jgi:hypothetical protein
MCSPSNVIAAERGERTSTMETLTLVTNRAYLRTCTANMDVPFYPNDLKTAIEPLAKKTKTS